jgi:hypothetical protein
MAIVFTSRLFGGNTAAQTTYTTASITPATDGSPMALWVLNTKVSTTSFPSVSTVTGLGLTWTPIYTTTTRDSGSVCYRLTLVQGIGTASTGTVDITNSNALSTGTLWGFVQMAGADMAVPFVSGHVIESTLTSAQTSTSLILANTPAVGNAILAAVAHQANEAITAGTNYTTAAGTAIASPTAALHAEWKTILNTTVDASWVTSSFYVAAGVEVQVAITGTGAFAAGAAAFSGTSTETITGTGAFTAPAPALAGTGTSLLAITGTGAFGAAAASFHGTATSTAAAGPSGGGATATPFSTDFIVTTPPIPQLLIRGSGGIQGAPSSLYGVMEVGPDPAIAIRHREDDELLRLLP